MMRELPVFQRLHLPLSTISVNSMSLTNVIATTRMLEEAVEDPCARVDVDDYDHAFQIAAIFIIFVVSGIGVGIPLLSKHNKTIHIYPYIIVLGKCAGIGVMLACSLVHMIQPANESLTSECVSNFFNATYPAFAFFVAIVAILSVHYGEFLLSDYLQNQSTDLVQSSGKALDDDDVPADDDGHTLQKVPHDVANTESKLMHAKYCSEVIMVQFSLTVHSVLIGISSGSF
jgi:solute carrier family 39 (zinc transporter), member 1/2/3